MVVVEKHGESSLQIRQCENSLQSCRGESRRNLNLIRLDAFSSGMNLEETVDYLAAEFDLQRSEHVRETGESVAELRD